MSEHPTSSDQKPPFIKVLLIRGLTWGLIMFLIMELAFPWATEGELNNRNLFLGFLLWMVAGFILGWILMKIEGSRKS